MDKTYSEYLESLAIDAAIEKIDARTMGVSCQCCGGREWVVEGTSKPDGQTDASATFLPKHLGGQPAIPLAAFACTNCGFVRLHNLMVLRDAPSSAARARRCADDRLYRALGMAVAIAAGARRKDATLPGDATVWADMIRIFAEMTDEEIQEVLDWEPSGSLNPAGFDVARPS